MAKRWEPWEDDILRTADPAKLATLNRTRSALSKRRDRIRAPFPPRRPRADQWTPAEDAIIRSGKRWAIDTLGRTEAAIAGRRTALRAPPASPSFKRRWSREEDRAIIAAANREGVRWKYADVATRYGRTTEAIRRRACILRRQHHAAD